MSLNAESEPTDWFRIRHADPFADDAIAAFHAACALFRAKIATMLEHWDALPSLRQSTRPTVTFFAPEVSADRRMLSLPARVEGQTLGSRSLLQSTAGRELHVYLPFPLWVDVEVGLTEPAFDGNGWRSTWWSPTRDDSISGEEAVRRAGVTATPASGPSLVPRLRGWLASLLRKARWRP